MRNLYSLQVYQKEHDEKYHADICALPHPERIRHLVLHFAKYTGRLVDPGRQDKACLGQTLSDSFIIGLSMANILSLNLDMEIQKCGLWFLPFKSQGVLKDFAFFGGIMAKACESLDHMESHDYKKALTDGLLGIFIAIFSAEKKNRLDMRMLVANRWKEIEIKNIL